MVLLTITVLFSTSLMVFLTNTVLFITLLMVCLWFSLHLWSCSLLFSLFSCGFPYICGSIHYFSYGRLMISPIITVLFIICLMVLLWFSLRVRFCSLLFLWIPYCVPYIYGSMHYFSYGSPSICGSIHYFSYDFLMVFLAITVLFITCIMVFLWFPLHLRFYSLLFLWCSYGFAYIYGSMHWHADLACVPWFVLIAQNLDFYKQKWAMATLQKPCKNAYIPHGTFKNCW